MQPDENSIRERAYRIWQREGCPEGRDHIHWQMAVEELAVEEGGETTTAAGGRGGSGPMSDVAPPQVARAAPRKPRATSRSTAKKPPPR